MSLGVIAVIFGLCFPIFNTIYRGMIENDDVRAARKKYNQEHPVMSIVGTFIGIIPIAAYWIFVITNLL